MLKLFYEGCHIKALTAIYPEHKLLFWKFRNVPKGYWDSGLNQRKYFDHTAQDLGLGKFEDWYSVSGLDIRKMGGKVLLNRHFEGSLNKALPEVFPEYEWRPWLFDKATHGFWEDESNVKKYLEWLSDKLEISTVEAWSQVTAHHIAVGLKGYSLLKKSGGLIQMLSKYVPQYLVEQRPKMSTGIGKAQMSLYRCVQNLFPEIHIQLDYRHPDMVFSKTGQRIELDIFLPSLNLALEFQGKQHYNWHFVYGSPSRQQHRDSEKKEICAKYGITLIEVPYWWQTFHNVDHLVTTIRNQRPGMQLPVLFDILRSPC